MSDTAKRSVRSFQGPRTALLYVSLRLTTALDTPSPAMASSPNLTGLKDPASETNALSDAPQVTSLTDTAEPAQNGTESPQADPNETRPLRIYTRAQLLNLHRSPLVQAPPDMPELKVWFG